MTVNMEQRKKWDVSPGNTVKVWQKIKEGDKFRLQAFEGLVIAHKHGFEPGATFTVRKISSGIGVERIFPVFSPAIEKIDVTKTAKTRKSKLYYVRTKAAKEIRRKMKTLKVAAKKESPAAAEAPKETEKAEEGK
ncbi:50S ribosomal protein L19 [Candidatus Parcubacteria bacterium]|nr:MAG: 50S ribosomal protein L19 [Candidatus Parcubacteria bacterium]